MSDAYLSPEEVLTNLGVAYDYKVVKPTKWLINPRQCTDTFIVTSVYELGLGYMLTALELEANMKCVYWGEYFVLIKFDPQDAKIVFVRNGEDCENPLHPADGFTISDEQVVSWTHLS